MPSFNMSLILFLYWSNWIEIKYCCGGVEALIHYRMWRQREVEGAGLLQPGEEQDQGNKHLSPKTYMEVIKKMEAGSLLKIIDH